MRKLFIFIAGFFLLAVTNLQAQNVAINANGTQPDASAILDVSSSTKGILIPRVALGGTTDNTTIPSPKISLLVYNTISSGQGSTAVEPGFYYWGGTAWSRLMNDGNKVSSPWALGGNTGTDPATHFIGTVDSVSLQFRVNNQPSGKIDINNVNTFFGYQAGRNYTSGWGSIGIGQNALVNNTSGYDNIAIGEGTLGANTTSFDNVAVGKFSLTNNTSGSRNVALGNLSLSANTTGAQNTALGRASMYTNTTGQQNTALGFQSLVYNTGGSSNVALGQNALFNNTTGNENTAVGRVAMNLNITGSANTNIGFASEVGASNLSNATAIGARSIVGCNNCLVLGSSSGANAATSDVNVGISVPSPTQPLTFKNVLGGKISFWDGAGGRYGFGVQSGLFQMYSDIQASDIAFGWGKSESFTETMRIKNSGLIGIGTTAPAHMLDVSGNSHLQKAQIRLHEMENEYARLRFTNTSSSNFWDVAAKTDVAATDAYMNFYYSPNGMNVFSLRGNGTAVLAGTLTQNSDARLKKNIRRLDNPVGGLLQLNGYHYNWNEAGRDTALQTGLLAQEVQEVFPELVSADEKGTLSVNYMAMIPLLLEALKTQQKEIDELKKALQRK